MKARAATFLSAMAISALFIDYAACTVWNDAVVGGGGQGGGTTSSSSSTGGGDAGNPNDLGGLLKVDEAVLVCTMAATNDALASSIVASLGLPIGVANTQGFVHVASQSECLNWLAGPIPSNRKSNAAQPKAVLKKVAAAYPDASKAAAMLSIQYLPLGDGLCRGMLARCGDNDVAYVCRLKTPSFVRHCGDGLFAGTSCMLSGVGVDREPFCVVTGAPCPKENASCKDDTTFFCATKNVPEVAYNCGYTGLNCGSTFCQSPDSSTEQCSNDAFGMNACSSDHKQLRMCDGILYLDYECDTVLEGSKCVTETDQTVKSRCKYKDEKCHPNGGGDIDSCNDKKLTVCVTGKKVVVDCPSGSSCAGSYCIAND